MSLSYRQQNQLRRIEAGLRRPDPHLGAMLTIFGRLYPDQDLPAWEQVPQVPSGQDRLHRAAAWFVAALIATAAVISVLLAAVAAATAGWRLRGTGRRARTSPPGPGSWRPAGR
jgi:hypothetical protein